VISVWIMERMDWIAEEATIAKIAITGS